MEHYHANVGADQGAGVGRHEQELLPGEVNEEDADQADLNEEEDDGFPEYLRAIGDAQVGLHV